MDDQLLILHIEDESEIFDLIVEVLQHSRLDFINAPDGIVGLSMAEEHRPDLILLDIMILEIDGYQVFDRLRARPETSGIPVIMLTVKNRPHERIRADKIEGLEAYVGKPFNVIELRKKVEENLGIKY